MPPRPNRPLGDGAGGCDNLSEGLSYYGYTGPEVFIADIELGFVKTGSNSYNGFEYDYGYAAFYLGYPDYYWYTSASYLALSYENCYDANFADVYGYNGYFGITFTP